jgi:uncharacterized protein YjbI with pentapeptide repeats
VLPAVVLASALLLGIWGYNRLASAQHRAEASEHRLHIAQAVIDSLQANNLTPVMQNLLEEVAREASGRSGRTLSDTTLARIAALSHALKPYRLLENDTVTEQPVSAGRGRLLQALVLLRLHPETFAHIRRTADFSYADLRGASLQATDLRGINLYGARLKNAVLDSAFLHGADLRKCALWGVQLNGATLDSADLRHTDARWAQLNGSFFRGANLDGANLAFSQWRNAQGQGASMQWAQAQGALFAGATLNKVNGTGTFFDKADFRNANLEEADVRRCRMTDADFSGARLNRTLVDPDWFEKLNAWHVPGAAALQERFAVAQDTTGASKEPVYRLFSR